MAGIYLEYSDDNRIIENLLIDNTFGICPYPQIENNTIEGNIFINNSIQLYIDTDQDNFPDEIDAFPNDPNEWLDTDGDGIGDNTDDDDDGDGYNDTMEEEFDTEPLNASSHPDDYDSDLLPDEYDDDDDNDGVLDWEDLFPYDSKEWADADGDNIGDNADPDYNGNNIPDVLEVPLAVILILFPVILLVLYNKKMKRKKEPSEDPGKKVKDEEETEFANEKK